MPKSSNVYALENENQHHSKKMDYKEPCFKNKKHIDLDDIKLKAIAFTENHQKIIDAIDDDKITIITGCAGTGKTFIPLNKAMEMLANKLYKQVVIFRSTVGVREDGHLPGDEKEKIAPFETPYIQIIKETFNGNSDQIYHDLKENKKIIFKSTRFNQGLTIQDSFIIVDEAQNMSYKELYNLYTRIGKGSTIHFIGDYKKQTLLNKSQSGLEHLINVIKSSPELMDDVRIIDMTIKDIVRSEKVKRFIVADFNYVAKL